MRRQPLTFIDYSVKQVQRWPIGNSPLGVLLNPDRDLGSAARVVATGDPRLLSVEARDPKHPEYGRITIGVRASEASGAGRTDAPGLGGAGFAK